MGRRGVLFLVICFLNGLLAHLNAETVTYDFSSTEYWVLASNGVTHPGIGSESKIQKIYYTGNDDCFVGSGNVYFSNEGCLVLNTSASLKIPYRDNWTIRKVILRSHSSNSSSTAVNIFSAYDTKLSKEQKWSPSGVYEYTISSTNLKDLYIKTKNSAARITSVTIDYASANGGNEDDSGTDEDDKEFVVSAPIFNPVSASFSTESLVVTMDASEGCEIFYTTDGSTPLYISAEEYNGIKGDIVTICKDDSKVTLQAIAINPITGESSDVCSATYTYVPIGKNDGSKTKPYTVAEVAVMTDTKKDKWVKGTIYGTMIGESPKNIATSDFTVASNLVIGDGGMNIPVQLLQGSVRNAINLKDHPYLKGKEVLLKGSMEEYCGARGVKNTSEYQIIYDVPINSYGYATLYLDMSVSVPDGCTAYYCTTEGDKVNLLPVGDVIPSNVGVIINAEPNKTYSLPYTTRLNSDESSIVVRNQLIGFVEDVVVTDDKNSYYALNVKNNKLGFYIPQTSTEGGFTAKAHKAYLQVPMEYKAAMFLIHFESDETVIVPITNISGDVIYDLYGRKVFSPVPGIYIRGGKKFVIE